MNSEEIVTAFNNLFGAAYDTILRGGANEPLYRAATSDRPVNEIWFRDDYPSSALHEIAHWCIAGEKRRQQDDYGYWYVEQRDAQQQRHFELIEARPQGLEWVLSIAAEVEFRVSCDNFNLECLDIQPLRARIREEALTFVRVGLPPRAEQLLQRFADYSSVKNTTSATYFEELPR